jgi:hypothetical protein
VRVDIHAASLRSRDPKKPSPLRAVATSPMKNPNLTSTAKMRTAKPWAPGAPIVRMAAAGPMAVAGDADMDAADVDVVHAAAVTGVRAAVAIAATGRPLAIGPRINANKREWK